MTKDLIIIGGGPAGMTAAIFAKRKNLNFLLLTKDFLGSATKTNLIENFPGFEKISGKELIEKMKKQIEKLGVEYKEGEIVKKIEKKENFFEIKTQNSVYQAKVVIVGTGLLPRRLNIPGEEKFIGKGISYCTICDGPLFKGKVVAVIGGGNAGAEASLFLAEIAKKVYLLEISDRLCADETLQKEIKENPKISVILKAKVKEICGKEKVEELIYENIESKKEYSLKIDGVFIEIGGIPVVNILGELVDFNEKREVVIDHKTCMTKTPGLFAVGDITDIKYKQIVIACAQGAIAALFAYDFLKKNERN